MWTTVSFQKRGRSTTTLSWPFFAWSWRSPKLNLSGPHRGHARLRAPALQLRYLQHRALRRPDPSTEANQRGLRSTAARELLSQAQEGPIQNGGDTVLWF